MVLPTASATNDGAIRPLTSLTSDAVSVRVRRRENPADRRAGKAGEGEPVHIANLDVITFVDCH